MSKDTIHTISIQQCSDAGKAAGMKMSKEARQARSRKASHSRKCYKGIPKATHFGELTIGNVTVSCAVLEDGRRVITETSMFELLQRAREGRKKGGSELPAFISANNLKPYITNELIDGVKSFEYLHPQRGKVNGLNAMVIPLICEAYINAHVQGVLKENQLKSAYQALIITQALAKTGIISLVDEVTSYQEFRENNELQKLFNRFLSEELQPWTKRFPSSFFKNIKKMYGLEHLKGNPRFAGHLINRYIYGEISPEILEELKRRNPLNEKGYRANKHHQYLSDDVGHPALTKQIIKINTLMSVSSSKEEFEELFEKAHI